MTCERTDEILEGLTLGEGPGSGADAGLEREAHLSACGPCRAAADQLREVEGALRAVRAPAGFADGVAARIEAGRASPAHVPSRFWTLGRAAVAASLLATLAMGAVYIERAGRRLEARLEGKAAPPGAGTPPPAVAAVAPAFSLEVEAPAALSVGDEVEAVVRLRRDAGTAAPFEVSIEALATDALEAFVVGPDTALLPSGADRRLRLVLRGAHAGPASVTVVARAVHPDPARPESRPVERSAARAVLVLPDGRALSVGAGASLAGPRAQVLARLPLEALRLGAPRALTLRVLSGALAEAELGLRDLVREPHGCFEQTTAATYPSLMVLTLARETGQVPPALEARARDAATKGARRLGKFQMPDGGFSYHGDGPSLPWLTAYGLQELAHLARAGVEVEAGRIERAAARLLAFEDGRGGLAGAEDPGSSSDADGFDVSGASEVAVRAFAAHALAASGAARVTGVADARIARIVDRVEREAAEARRSVYELALAAKALHALGRAAPARALAARIEAAAAPWGEKGVAWSHGASRTLSLAGGRAADVETTALAVQVLLACGDPALAARGLAGLFALRRADGYGGTQAAVQALEAVRAAGGVGGRPEGVLTAHLGGALAARVELSGAGGDGLIELPLRQAGAAAGPASADPGSLDRAAIDRGAADAVRLAVERGVELTFVGEGTARVQVVASGVAPFDFALSGPSGLEGGPDRLTVSVERPASAPEGPQLWTIRVANPTKVIFLAPMIAADLPAGFTLEGDGGLAALIGAGILAHEIHDGRLALYLADLHPGASLALPVRLLAAFPGRLTTGAVEAYAYYDRAETLALAPTERVTVERAPPPPEEPAGPAFDAEAASVERLIARVAPPVAPRPVRASDDEETGSDEGGPAPRTRATTPEKPGTARPRRHQLKDTILVAWDRSLGPLPLDLEAFPLGCGDLDRVLTRSLAASLPDIAELEAGPDGAEVFRLDPARARWSDGAPILPVDVMRSWERARATLGGSTAPSEKRPALMDVKSLDLLERMEWRAVGDRAIQVRAPFSTSEMCARLAMVPFLIGPREAPADGKLSSLVTSGGYSVKSVSPERITLISRARDLQLRVEAGASTANADVAVGCEPEGMGRAVEYAALPAGASEARERVRRALLEVVDAVAAKAMLNPPGARAIGAERKHARATQAETGGLPPLEIVSECDAAAFIVPALSEALRALGAAPIETSYLRGSVPLAEGAVRIYVSASVGSTPPDALPLGWRSLPWRFSVGMFAGEQPTDSFGYMRAPDPSLLQTLSDVGPAAGSEAAGAAEKAHEASTAPK